MTLKNRDDLFISVVSPVYKAEKIVDELIIRLVKSLEEITDNFEIILVEDCGPDKSWEAIKRNCERDGRIIGIKLSRNFGQHHAITAGLDSSKGEWVVVMDCDLQDRPDQIPRLLKKAQEGYDIVLARRHQRKDNFLKRLSSNVFHIFLSYLSGTKFDSTIGNFGIYNKKVIRNVQSMRESIRYFPTMIKWVGFSSTLLDVDHDERFEGKTSYHLKKLLQLALNIMLAYSDKPLRIMINFGLLMSTISFVFGCYVLIRAFTIGFEVTGYGSLIFSIWFVGGIIISMLGIVGLYISKIFERVKNRPIYIIDELKNKM